MSAPKSLPLILPAVLVVFPLMASAQEIAKSATLTSAPRPASAIAPRQSLPTFAPAKTNIVPVGVAPIAGKSAPIDKATPAEKVSALTPVPATQTALPIWSQREKAALVVPQPLNAPLAKARARRAYAAAVSATTSPLTPSAPPAAQVAPVAQVAPATQLSPVAEVVPIPKAIAKAAAPKAAALKTEAPAPKIIAKSQPSQLSSREARARDLKLARLDAQLAGAERRLDRAQTRLTDGQRQLGSVNSLLQNAIITQGAGARGLHPFVRVAQRYLGTPYVWGGESARGFDCSGFIMRVMRDLGYRALPHSAAEQFNYGKPIAKPFLQPGDIVFFANTYKPGVSHVGIYLGKSRFIHAANSQVGTIVSSLDEPKWIEKYAGARRLMKLN